ncbi:SERTA domain-containing protein 3 [Etheostoma cragini]|uniref:SERTA domain-containing protein 3 n=1 Tax=Etheostoma cragini TaxID=417921 RepID=UPI00155E5348|nr:SERTA domain-containing protein 3 [Etheostoma cragini]XP_034723911.1 SERTA domain-containing protein 3 [Etheostoma cragini]XP_034723912.1 SERTA domain-containing protein 3 [Etheostoma cragini]
MIMKGQKRKLPPEDVQVSDPSSPTWESQRQFVFSVSLNKYQHGQELPEPSLRRSVLIANTLRQVSLEACRAPSVDMKVLQPLCSSSSDHQESTFTGVALAKYHSAVMLSNSHSAPVSCPLVSLNYFSNSATSRSPATCHLSASNVPQSVKDEDEDWGMMSTESDFSLSAAISSILTALDSTIDGSPQAAPRTPLRSLENLSGPSEQAVRGNVGSWEQHEEWRLPENTVEVMRSSYLSELTVEDLFQDIDTSLLERDMGVLGLRGSGSGYQAGDDLLRYLQPFSSSSFPPSNPFSLSQNLKCLPSFSSFCPLSSSSSSSPAFSSPNLVREGLELEHLMEILVES